MRPEDRETASRAAPTDQEAHAGPPRGDREMLRLSGLGKSFRLHNQGGVEIPALSDVGFTVRAGQCLALAGPSGSGKSSLMRMIYGNYRASTGRIEVRDGPEWVDVAAAAPRRILALRRQTLGYVSQFLRVVPRVATIDVVAEPLVALGRPREAARERAAALLTRLNLPERLWELPPATFSGGEQQRVNIARGFAVDFPVLLLDEPTASLDRDNAAAVVEMIAEAKARGAALVGIFHDINVRRAVADLRYDMEAARETAA